MSVDVDIIAVHRGQVRVALRLAATFGDQLMHVNGLGWFSWDGKRWARDERGFAKRAVLEVLRACLTDSLEDPELRTDVRRCESASGISGVLEIAAALEQFAFTVAELDADPYLLNTATGTLDLRTKEVRMHDPRDRITKLTRGGYVEGASSAVWTGFLGEVLPDEMVVEFLQRFAGLGVVGTVLEHILGILTGTGGNGKGTFCKAIGYALGDYALSAEPDLFMQRHGAHPTGEMDLRGARWVVVSESDQGRRLAEATMKRLTGGDTIRARSMRRDFVEFEPSHTAALVTNHLPKVSGGDPAIWRRVRVIPFNVVISTEDANPHLNEQLERDADAILGWLVAGYWGYAASGMNEPDAVTVATDSYQRNSDAVARFIDECCHVAPDVSETTTNLHNRWSAWAIEDGADAMSTNNFGRALEERGFPAGTGGRAGRARRGIRLRTEKELG